MNWIIKVFQLSPLWFFPYQLWFINRVHSPFLSRFWDENWNTLWCTNLQTNMYTEQLLKKNFSYTTMMWSCICRATLFRVYSPHRPPDAPLSQIRPVVDLNIIILVRYRIRPSDERFEPKFWSDSNFSCPRYHKWILSWFKYSYRSGPNMRQVKISIISSL